MKLQRLVLILVSLVFTQQVAAYGSSSSSKKACKKPTFSEFIPANMSEVSAQSEFSFLASSNTLPDSITVSVKNQDVAIQVSGSPKKYRVTGKLPNDIDGDFARINIQAVGPKKCKGKGGWLLKIVNSE